MMPERTWTTWWSKAQRGVGLVNQSCEIHQEVRIQISNLSAIRFHFAAYYEMADVELCDVICITSTSRIPVYFQQKESIVISTLQAVCSDIVEVEEDSSFITLAYTLKGSQPISSGIELYPYDEVQTKGSVVYGLQGIDVYSDAWIGCISVFGDSIVEQGTWTTPVKQWLEHRGYRLLNHGISGNRLCHDLQHVVIDPTHAYMFEQTNIEGDESIGIHTNIPLSKQCFGKAGKVRFQPEILEACANLTHVIFAIGINDLYQPGSLYALLEELIDETQYHQEILKLDAFVKEMGVQTMMCTLTPFLKSKDVNIEKEILRNNMNDWIKKQSNWLTFFDFDPVLKDETGAIKKNYHRGDYLHPSEKGGSVMANVVITSLEAIL